MHSTTALILAISIMNRAAKKSVAAGSTNSSDKTREKLGFFSFSLMPEEIVYIWLPAHPFQHLNHTPMPLEMGVCVCGRQCTGMR